MPGEIELKHVGILIIIFVLLSFVQITESMFASGYAITKAGESEGLLNAILNYLGDLPIIGVLFNFFTINIPNAPDIILAIVNVINTVVWLYFAICLNNLIVFYFDLDEGLLGILGLS